MHHVVVRIPFLLDKSGVALAKIDGGRVGLDSMLVELSKKLGPYPVSFYRRSVWSGWELQVAGDAHWAPTDAPLLVRKNSRRMDFIMIIGCITVAIFIALSVWLQYRGHDRLR